MSFYANLLVLTAGLLPTYIVRFSVAGIPTTLLEVSVWLAALTGLLSPAVIKSWKSAWRKIPKTVVILAGLFLLAAILSTLVSPHLHTSMGILKGWIITPLLFAWLVYAQGVAKKDFSLKIIYALTLSGLVVALLGLSQLGQLDRIQGPYDVPNSLAMFLAPLIVLAAFSHDRFLRLSAIPMITALMFTQSLAGVAVVTITLLLGFLIIQKLDIAALKGEPRLRRDWSLSIRHWSFAAVAIGLLLAVTLFLFIPKIEYLTQPNSSAQVRLQLWSISWELIREHPLLGIGLGTFEPAYQQKLHERFLPSSTYNPKPNTYNLIPTTYHLPPIPEFVFRDPHNWILSFWLNTGLLGLMSFTAIHMYVFYWSFRHWDLIDHWSLGIGHSAALALLALLLFGLVDTIYWKNDLAIMHWLFVFLAPPHRHAKVSVPQPRISKRSTSRDN